MLANNAALQTSETLQQNVQSLSDKLYPVHLLGNFAKQGNTPPSSAKVRPFTESDNPEGCTLQSWASDIRLDG